MAYKIGQFQELCHELRSGDRENIQPLDLLTATERSAFELFSSLASRELLQLLGEDIDLLAKAASEEGEKRLVDHHFTVARTNALQSRIIQERDERELFVSALNAHGVADGEAELKKYSLAFTWSILSLVGYYNWAGEFANQ